MNSFNIPGHSTDFDNTSPRDELNKYIHALEDTAEIPQSQLTTAPVTSTNILTLSLDSTYTHSDDDFNQFFNDAFYGDTPEYDNYKFLPGDLTGRVGGSGYAIPDSAIDPLLGGFSDDNSQELVPIARYLSPPAQHSHPSVSTTAISPTYSPGLTQGVYPVRLPSPSLAVETVKAKSTATRQASSVSTSARRSKIDESTFDLSWEAKAPTVDERLHDPVRRNSIPIKCPPPTSSQNPARYLPYDPQLVAASGLFISLEGTEPGPLAGGTMPDDMDQFLAYMDPELLDPAIDSKFTVDSIAGFPTSAEPTEPIGNNPLLVNQVDYIRWMLVPYPTPIQPCEKRKRGRPKKDEVEESQQPIAPLYPVRPMIPYHAKALTHVTPQIQQAPLPGFFPVPQSVTTHNLPTPTAASPDPLPATKSDTDTEDESDYPTKRRKRTINGNYRSMSRKEQAYLEMDRKVKLYDENNIHELLYFPTLRHGRTPCFWVQRHPYANTRIYSDHYRTWCRYRHCKGVETHELIRTATGEFREKNYKHPRTIIAGNYQVAVDWEYVDDEIQAFGNDPDGQFEYDKRNVYDTIECFFHLRCFESLTNFPQLIRDQIVKIDHRVLNKDKSRNKITKRKNKGGTNAAEIEWYLKEEAEQWMERVKSNSTFNPLPWSDNSLERLLLNGKKSYNEKKGMNKFESRATSPTSSIGTSLEWFTKEDNMCLDELDDVSAAAVTNT
ncbi:hypothetical protein ABW19_dt0204741 [Dactylella cylindrospora]|nr:hypothetical protein ABW19_dt0204741 [Dactylella cylindrospora]